jgi:hypothetical protein
MTAPVLSWCAVDAGFIGAFYLERKSPAGSLLTLGLFIADAVGGVALAFVDFVAVGVCFSLSSCAQTTDIEACSPALPDHGVTCGLVATLAGKIVNINA